MFLVCEDANLLNPLNERFVELWPRATSERNDTHVVVGHYQPVCQHLQGIEGRIEHNLCIRHFVFDGIGKAKEQGVARGKDYY